jgi:hypothetical protein
MIQLGPRVFEGPFPIDGWTPPARAAGVCIMVPDARREPPFRPVYVGYSANHSERAFPGAQPGRASWLDIADYDQGVYVAAYWMPQSTLDERKALERRLVQSCQPECNEVFRGRSLVLQ